MIGTLLGLFGRRSPADVVAAQEAHALAESGSAIMIDVREAQEWHQGHVAGAVHLPLSRFAAEIDRLPRGRPAVFYCATGMRSSRALRLARAAGFEGARHMGGGIAAWQRCGYPLARPSPGA